LSIGFWPFLHRASRSARYNIGKGQGKAGASGIVDPSAQFDEFAGRGLASPQRVAQFHGARGAF
jgi:hypothetical protein